LVFGATVDVAISTGHGSEIAAVYRSSRTGPALLPATIGLYGTLSYLLTQRRIEFGIRMALGAASRAILGLVVRDYGTLVLGGIVAGTGLSLLTTRLPGALLFGIEARDPVTMAMGGVLMASVSLPTASGSPPRQE
jgi:ABC-type antimicrobial peptide transport system permease subunit